MDVGICVYRAPVHWSSMSLEQLWSLGRFPCMSLTNTCFLLPVSASKAPNWTSPSSNSSERQTRASESSWTTNSEDTSSPSIAPSYTDLQSLNTEDLTSGRTSAADSAGKREPFSFHLNLFDAPQTHCSELSHREGIQSRTNSRIRQTNILFYSNCKKITLGFYTALTSAGSWS